MLLCVCVCGGGGGGGGVRINNVESAHNMHVHVAVTSRRTLFHSMWANSISYISRMLY